MGAAIAAANAYAGSSLDKNPGHSDGSSGGPARRATSKFLPPQGTLVDIADTNMVCEKLVQKTCVRIATGVRLLFSLNRPKSRCQQDLRGVRKSD